MPLPEGAHADRLREAIEAEARGHRALLAGEPAAAALERAAALYRASWEAAPPRSFGRLIGMLKAAVIAGDAADAAAYAREAVPEADSPPSSYVRAIVADFEQRDEHLTGVPIADTALMLERLAAERGMASGPTSPLLPPGG
jgi:hypothetical protein